MREDRALGRVRRRDIRNQLFCGYFRSSSSCDVITESLCADFQGAAECAIKPYFGVRIVDISILLVSSGPGRCTVPAYHLPSGLQESAVAPSLTCVIDTWNPELSFACQLHTYHHRTRTPSRGASHVSDVQAASINRNLFFSL